MTTENLIKNLEIIREENKDRIFGTGELNILSMCDDVISKLKELQDQSKDSYRQGWNDCAVFILDKITVIPKYME